MSDLHSLTLKKAVDLLAKGGAKELYQSLANRIQVLNPKLNALLRFDPKNLPSPSIGPLQGAPVSVKDNICIQGQ